VEFRFVLRYVIDANSTDDVEIIERLGSAGCDDALVGLGLRGRLALDFTREATSAREAIHSAIRDVRVALPNAQLSEAGPDVVGLSDIAELLEVSRQNARKLIMVSRTPPPIPIHEGRPTVWRLAKVLEWLRLEKGYPIDRGLEQVAVETMQLNLAIGLLDYDSQRGRELRDLVAR
jgi:hypothetical protein